MRIRFTTLNAWALPEPFSRHLDGRLHAIGEELVRLAPDVVALQEVWTADARHRLIEAGRRAGCVHVWHRDATLGGSGLLVLSRFPIAHARFTRFAVSGLPQRVQHADYYGGKGFVQIQLRTPVAEVEVVTTHLQAAYGGPPSEDEYLGHRIAQIVEIAAGLASLHRPVVLLGDFNFYDDRAEISILTGLLGVRDVAAELGCEQETAITRSPYRMNERPPGSRPDYVFARGGASGRLLARDVRRVFDAEFEVAGERATFSDHAGVWAELDVSRHAAPAPVPAPSAAAVEQARELLHSGMNRAHTRRGEQRASAGLAGVTALVALVAARRSEPTRRRLLRGLLLGATGTGMIGTVGLLALAERFAPEELSGYDRVLEKLEQLGRPRPVHARVSSQTSE
jgi:endonuclease/exonuclease/phosphatase family metal-dependent hydrolase